MIEFKNATFVKSAPSINERPEKHLPEVCFVGKSNVGKSSLINALTKRKQLAFTSSKPGFTKLLNYYNIDERFYLVDAPGYGFTISGSKHLDSFAKMMEDYFNNDSLKGVLFLIDSRHKMSKDDLDFYSFVKSINIPFILVVTKVDKLNQKEKAQMKKNIKESFGEIEYLESIYNDEKYINVIRERVLSLALSKWL